MGWLIFENSDRDSRRRRRKGPRSNWMGGAEGPRYQPSAAICEPLVEQSWKLQPVHGGKPAIVPRSNILKRNSADSRFSPAGFQRVFFPRVSGVCLPHSALRPPPAAPSTLPLTPITTVLKQRAEKRRKRRFSGVRSIESCPGIRGQRRDVSHRSDLR